MSSGELELGQACLSGLGVRGLGLRGPGLSGLGVRGPAQRRVRRQPQLLAVERDQQARPSGRR